METDNKNQKQHALRYEAAGDTTKLNHSLQPMAIQDDVTNILHNLMTNSFNFVKNHLPTNDRIGFLNVYRSKLPYNAFLQYYPAKDIDNTLEHLDNVNYAAVVIQLTSNTSAGLFVKKSDRQEEIHLQQAEGDKQRE